MTRYESKYKVLNIAEYVIQKSIDVGNPIDHLKLQKILYYIQAKFLVEKKVKCFDEPILAWRFGPVIESVYRRYNKYSSMNLYPKNKSQFNNVEKCDAEIIDSLVNKYAEKNAWFLVEQTHREKPWLSTPQSSEISADVIRRYYSREGKNSICN